jgi:hypothetical protein
MNQEISIWIFLSGSGIQVGSILHYVWQLGPRTPMDKEILPKSLAFTIKTLWTPCIELYRSFMPFPAL